MLHQRGAGVLMHISSLPSPYGIGVFDRHARDFIDRIADMGFTYWQVLPFNPIDGAGSPIAPPPLLPAITCLSTRRLQDMGLATAEEVAANHYDGTPYTADFAFAGERRLALLEQAFLRIDDTLAAKIKAFEVENPWLTDYSVFMAVKEAEGGKPGGSGATATPITTPVFRTYILMRAGRRFGNLCSTFSTCNGVISRPTPTKKVWLSWEICPFM